MEAGHQSQVPIVTHAPIVTRAPIGTRAPIVMGHPGARLLRNDRHGLAPVAPEDIEHVRILRVFAGDSTARSGS